MGRERPNLRAFFSGCLYNAAAFDEPELDIYAATYAAPGAMQAGFELYRAFDRDINDNQTALAAMGR
jgi:hypothetical protein